MRTLIKQYFGDGSEDTFAVPTLTVGFILDVKVAGQSVDFDYSTTNAVLVDAPADGEIIDMFETDEIITAKQINCTEVDDKENASDFATDDVAGAAVAAGVLAGGPYAVLKATTGVAHTLIASAAMARLVMIHVRIDEDYEIGTGTLPTIIIGETDTTNKFVAATILVDESNKTASPNQGKDLFFSGVLTAAKALLVTNTAAVGDSTGGCTISAMAMPT